MNVSSKPRTCPQSFVSQPITPDPASLDPSLAHPGEPAVPKRFLWRKSTLEITDVLNRWKTSGPCRNGSGEQYLRRHWYHLRTTDNQDLTVYFERQPRSRNRSHRWFLYTLGTGHSDEVG